MKASGAPTGRDVEVVSGSVPATASSAAAELPGAATPLRSHMSRSASSTSPPIDNIDTNAPRNGGLALPSGGDSAAGPALPRRYSPPHSRPFASTATSSGEAAAAPEGVSLAPPAAEAPVKPVDLQPDATVDASQAARTKPQLTAAIIASNTPTKSAPTMAPACQKVKAKLQSQEKGIKFDKTQVVESTTLSPAVGEETTIDISEKILWILRHGAKNVNLEVDSEGWVKVQDLISCEVLSSSLEARLINIINEANSQQLCYEVKGSEYGHRMIRAISASRRSSPSKEVDRKYRKNTSKSRKAKAMTSMPSDMLIAPSGQETHNGGDGEGAGKGERGGGDLDHDRPDRPDRDDSSKQPGSCNRSENVDAHWDWKCEKPHDDEGGDWTATASIQSQRSRKGRDTFSESGNEKARWLKAATVTFAKRPTSILHRIASRDLHEDDHASSHGEQEASIITAVVSAGINFLLMFGLCCAYGMIMFEDDWNARHRGLAVKMNLATALLAGLALAFFSGVPVAIGGPDLNPVVFLGMFVTTISSDIANQMGLDLPESSHRRLSGSSEGANFCVSAGSSSGSSSSSSSVSQSDCESYHEQLRATTIFAVTLSSAILGVLYFCLGRFRLTRFLAYIPTNIIEAFLSCIGYKVFKYALKFCKYNPKQFIPAACIGVPLYFVKALHIGNPAIVIPIMLILPMVTFYISVFATGETVQSVRDKGWMFDVIENCPFETVWTDGLVGKMDKINFGAWAATLPDLPIMIVICLMDCLLKLSSTDSKLPVKPAKDYEVQLYGATNALTTLCGSSVGYMQLKFNVIAYGVMGNVTDRRGGALYAIFCGVCFFWSTDLFNYLPRFFLSSLLFFAGSGFVAENLWGSRLYLSLAEWLQILVILAVFIFFGSLLYAVIVGGLLAGSTFVLRYARVPCLAAAPATGGSLGSCERRTEVLSYGIKHISDSWLMVVWLKGYIFFASGQKVTDFVMEYIKEKAENVPDHRRLKYVIFDCSQLDGMDPSASKSFTKLVKHAKELEVRVFWSGASEEFIRGQKAVGTISSERDCIHHLDLGVHKAEEAALDFIAHQQELWAGLHPCLRAYREWHRLRAASDPFAQILPSDMARFSCPWLYCTVMPIISLKTRLWKHGEVCTDLFLVHSGSVGLYTSMPEGEADFLAPLAVYGHGFFLNPESLLNEDAKYHAVALADGELLRWDEASWERMVYENPRMASSLMAEILRQRNAENRNLDRSKGPVAVTHDNASSPQRLSLTGEEESFIGDRFFRAETARSSFTRSSFGLTNMISCGYDEMPRELRHEINGLTVAQKLEDMGFFEMPSPEDEAPLPVLPDSLVQDLLVAYNRIIQSPSEVTPATGKSDNAQDSRLRQALAYAGLHGVLLDPKAPQWLEWDDFVELGRQATFMLLSERQCNKARELFRGWSKNRPGVLERHELVALFRSSFHQGLSAAEIDDIADVWCKKSLDVDEEIFIALISRFIRKHEHLWWLLQGFRAILKKDRLENGARITPADILTADCERLQAGETDGSPVVQRHPIAQHQAHAMLWCADSDAPSRDETADCRLATSVFFHHLTRYSKLPRSKLKTESDQTSVLSVMASIKLARGRRHAEPGDSTSSWQVSRTMSRAITGKILLVDSRSLTGTEASRFVRLLSAASMQNVNTVAGSMESLPQSYAESATASAEIEEEPVKAAASNLPESSRAALHRFLEDPSSGPWANRYSLFISMMILLAVLSLFLEPLIMPEEPSDSEGMIFRILEIFFNTGFTVELVLRFLMADALGTQTRKGFLKTPSNVIDFIAVVPFYFDLAFGAYNGELGLLRVVRLARLARLMRLFRLMKRSATFAPIAVVLVVIWGVYMKNDITG